jgi:hypothetical protein
MESLMVKAIRQLIRQAVCSTRSPQWLASPAYAERFHAPWHQIYGTMPNRRSPAVQYGPSQVDLQSRLDPEFPATGVLLLQGARLYGQSGWLFSKEGYLLPDHSWYGRHVDEMTEIPRFLPHGDAIAGVGLSLVSDFAVKNYGHFLLDCLGRLALFEQAGFTLADVDYLFCPKPPSKTAQRLFEQLGLAGCTCIWPTITGGVSSVPRRSLRLPFLVHDATIQGGSPDFCNKSFYHPPRHLPGGSTFHAPVVGAMLRMKRRSSRS